MKNKKLLIFVCIAFIILVIVIILPSSPSRKAEDIIGKPWSEMTYEEKENFLNDLIKNKRLEKADSELRIQLRDNIAKQLKNPSTVSFTLQPSIYNGFANVVEADSGWIYVPFRAKAKNDFGIEKELAGSVMFKYNWNTNTLGVRNFDLSQNN